MIILYQSERILSQCHRTKSLGSIYTQIGHFLEVQYLPRVSHQVFPEHGLDYAHQSIPYLSKALANFA